MQGLSVTLKALGFILQAICIAFRKRRDMVRFGYKKIIVGGSWEVREKRQNQRKQAGSTEEMTIRMYPRNNEDLDEGRSFKSEENKTPSIILLQASLKRFSGTQNS
jgi:hypothetical protein